METIRVDAKKLRKLKHDLEKGKKIFDFFIKELLEMIENDE